MGATSFLERVCTRIQVTNISLLLLFAFMAMGCGTLPSGRRWGQDAGFHGDWKRISQAAKNAALDPMTYVPVLGAVVVAAGDFDRDITDWAVQENPIFGSEKGARSFSDVGQFSLVAVGLGSSFMTPSGNDPGEWARSKAAGFTVEASGFLVAQGLTLGLKEVIPRERPDGSADTSMPSGHSMAAFAGASLANRNLNYIQMNPHARRSLQAANIAFASASAWARVEGERHYPTDVLVGAALGNFVTRFFHDAFIGIEPEDRFSFYLEPNTTGGRVFLSWSF